MTLDYQGLPRHREEIESDMTIRRKKLIGTVIFVSGSVFYFFFMITVAITRLPGTTMGTQLLFYLVITLIWLFFSALLIRWMQRPLNVAPQK